MSLNELLEKYDVLTEDGLQKAFEEIEKEEKDVDDALESILQKQCNLGGKLRSISQAYMGLSTVRNDASNLVAMIVKTSDLAESVSSKVRQLDLARSRVAECQERVNDLIDLQVCSAGVEDAIKKQDYERGALHVQRFLSMSDGSVKAASGSAPDTLHRAAHHLREHITVKFREATEKKNEANVERFFKLFPMLGMHEEGVKSYTRYLSEKFTESAKRDFPSISQLKEAHPTLFADAYTRLFESAAQTIESLRSTITTHCGRGFIIIAVMTLQPAVDRASKRLFNELLKVRNLPSVPVDPKRNPNKSLPDALALDPILSELALVHSTIVLYFGFLRRRVESDLDENKRETVLGDFEKFVNKCDLNRMSQDVLGHYLALERYHLDESISKAIKLAAPVDGQTNSSLIDDVFYIVRKCISRAISTQSLDGTCAVVNECARALERDAARGIVKALSVSPPLYPPSHPDRTLYLAHVSDGSEGMEYVSRLCSVIRPAAEALLARCPTSQADKLHPCLTSLQSVSESFKSAMEVGVKQLRLALKPRINSWIDEFTHYSHDPSEEEWVACGDEDEFTEKLFTHLEENITPLKSELSPKAYEALLDGVMADLTSRWENHLFNTSFNRVGGLNVERSVRRVCTWSGRRAPRLSACASILALETPADVVLAHTAALSQRDIKALLARRIDFRLEDIKRLKL